MKKIAIFLFLVVAVILLARNIIAKESLKYYLNSNFKIEASFEGVNVGLKKIIINEANLAKDNFQFKAKKIEARYKVNFLFQLSLESLEIVDAQLKDQQFGSLNFGLIPHDNYYQFLGNNLSFKGKEIGDFSLSIRLREDELYFYNLESTFIDSASLLSGYLDLGDFNNICMDLAAKDLALSDIVFLFGDKEEINLEGKFSGKVNCCFKNNKLSYLNLDVDDRGGGVINFKKETSLDFLKNRLDKKSYRYLLDNLKNYKYDKGNIKVDLEENDIVFEANFSSKELGERNITIKLHNILGGSK
ncbi:MAG: YdbH domain-containing protein [Candidatus Omnitrophota bacterium]